MKRRSFFGAIAGLFCWLPTILGAQWLFERTLPIVLEIKSKNPKLRQFKVIHDAEAWPATVMQVNGIPAFGSEWQGMKPLYVECSPQSRSQRTSTWIVEVRYAA